MLSDDDADDRFVFLPNQKCKTRGVTTVQSVVELCRLPGRTPRKKWEMVARRIPAYYDRQPVGSVHDGAWLSQDIARRRKEENSWAYSSRRWVPAKTDVGLKVLEGAAWVGGR